MERFERIVGPDGVLRGEALKGQDPGWHKDNLCADLMLLPSNAEQVSRILRLCSDERVAVVPQGGRTGLAGGAVTEPGQVILDTRRLDRIIEIEPVSRTAIVGAGVTLQRLQEAAAAFGLTPGIDLAARGSATIGGLVATNAGGIEAFRRGTMRGRLLGVEVVLGNGAVMSDLGKVLKNNTGYALAELIAGSEGTLGVVTNCVVRLDRLVPVAATAFLGCASLDTLLAASDCLRDRFPGRLRALEMMSGAYVLTALDQHRRHVSELGLPECEFYLLVDAEEDQDVDIRSALEGELGRLFDTDAVVGAVVAQNSRQREAMWLIREDSEAIERAWPHAKTYDISVPQSEIGRYSALLESRCRSVSPDLHVFVFGHIADGNLHVMVAGPQDVPEAGIEAALYVGLGEIGGSFSAEHGIGTEKLGALARYGQKAKLEAMAAIKAALDPRGILNPGKLLPPSC